MEIYRGSQTEVIKPGPREAVYMGPNCWNRPDWSEPVKVMTFLFGERQIGISLVTHDGKTDLPAALKTHLHGTFGGVPQNLVNALTAIIGGRQNDKLARSLTESLLYACHDFLQSKPPAPRKANATYAAVCLYIEENFQSNLTRESVARHFDLTPNHISRLFQQEGGITFTEYLTHVRIERAKFMLREYSATLKEVAASCGFRYVHYFCRVFRKTMRVTPTMYRSQQAR
jgi:YesN/AraC family two-component response regulator